MELETLIAEYSTSRDKQEKAIFSTLFFTSNRLQTLFDRDIPQVTLKQFMLLVLVGQPSTLTQLGKLLGCSRQNVKKLADALEKKGFITLAQSPRDPRATCVSPTQKMEDFFAHDFVQYEEKLKYVFEVYTDEELKTLFGLFNKLYEGIEHLEKRIKE